MITTITIWTEIYYSTYVTNFHVSDKLCIFIYINLLCDLMIKTDKSI